MQCFLHLQFNTNIEMNWINILEISLVLFAVIDILGSVPIIVNLRKRKGTVQSGKATIVAGSIMVGIVFLGDAIFNIFGIGVEDFALAGSIVIMIMAMEMILNRNFFSDEQGASNATIFPIAFPLVAGAGTLSTILSLRSLYTELEVISGILINLLIVYITLKSTRWIEKKLGVNGMNLLRKVFGIILLSIGIKIFKTNLFI